MPLPEDRALDGVKIDLKLLFLQIGTRWAYNHRLQDTRTRQFALGKPCYGTVVTKGFLSSAQMTCIRWRPDITAPGTPPPM